MKTKRVTRYYAECGKGFWKKGGAIDHEGNCKCWGNPKNRTCKTCEYGDYSPYECDTGSIGWWECNSPIRDAIEHAGAPKGLTFISVGCDHYLKEKALKG